MHKNRNLFLKAIQYLFCFIATSVSAQVRSDINVEKMYEKAESMLYGDQYARALSIYLSIDSLEPDNSNINFKIGLCYFNLKHEKIKSIPYFEIAAKNVSDKYKEEIFEETNAPVITNLYLGKVYHFNYEFDKAIEAFQIFKLYLEPSNVDLIKEVDRYIQMCNNAKEHVFVPLNVKITNLGENINSSYDDYSPLLTGDESSLLFTSRKPRSSGEKPADDGQYYEDIYISHMRNDWEKAVGISENINTPFQEATAGLSFDGQTLFVYKSKGQTGSLYKSELKGKEWTSPEIIDVNQEAGDWLTHATLTADRDLLYFVSDMPGGYGGKDIWMCKMLPLGEWGLPINLGPQVNSEYDEEAPFIHPGGKYLFFSSKGHNSMGGFDIFFVERNEENQWTERMNIGYPINTTDDDVFYVTSTDGRRSYFSSNRPGGLGGQDIYMATIENAEDNPLTILSGCIKSSGKDNLLTKIVIHVKNSKTGETFVYKPNTASGRYIMALNVGNYHLSYQYSDIEFYTEDIYVTEWIFNILTKDVEINLVQVNDDCLEPEVLIKKSKIQTEPEKQVLATKAEVEPKQKQKNIKKEKIRKSAEKKESIADSKAEKIKNVKASRTFGLLTFEFAADKVNKNSEAILNQLTDTLKAQKEIMVELIGHADNIGKPNYNMQLSKRRANAIKNVLVKNGISKKRIKISYCGDTKPVESNETEEGRTKNRRVEIIFTE